MLVAATALVIGIAVSGCVAPDQTRSRGTSSGTVLEHIEPTVSLEEQVSRLAGVYLNENRELRIRGAQGPPLIVVDGTRLGNRGTLYFVNVNDVERISVVRGPETAIYGLGGGDGVLLITTKDGRGGDD